MQTAIDARIRAKTIQAKKIARHHFGRSKAVIEYKPAGKTNFVFQVKNNEGKYIIRIGKGLDKLNDWKKEQWAMERAAEKNIPVPKILEIGHKVVSAPYMIQQSINGHEASDHPERLNVLEKLGAFARLIHTIPTNSFGSVFDWSEKGLPKKRTWKSYLENELKIGSRLRFLEKHEFLSPGKLAHMRKLCEKIKKWKIAPSLNHCDLRLKNVLTNNAGDILAIIDWENASSNIAPYWDLSIALHDLNIDAKQKFLEGYGLDTEEFEKMSYALTVFNLLNYIPTLQRMMERQDMASLNLYKLRLNGSLDLFSL
ncbi:MAG: aminoglycoside phosphotransferase family protein [Gemmatimonadaceae bacterium]|nr:aminoglycoside phosphotransferase family protein [Chitinophagaceae bacterium]